LVAETGSPATCSYETSCTLSPALRHAERRALHQLWPGKCVRFNEDVYAGDS
jgi:hypothetical protein